MVVSFYIYNLKGFISPLPLLDGSRPCDGEASTETTRERRGFRRAI